MKEVKRESSVAVYGLGRVGLPLAAAFARAGFSVIGVDINKEKVDSINRGEKALPSEPLVDDELQRARAEGRFYATDSLKDASEAARYKLITVPVMLNGAVPVYSALDGAVRGIGEGIKKEDVVVLESSVPPGTTRKHVVEALSGLGLVPDVDFFAGYSPERIYEGRALADIEENYKKVISGAGPRSLGVIRSLYLKVAKKGVIEMSSIEAAEAEKLFEGVYRDVNIALANELALLCERLGLDYWEIREAANSQPYCHLHKPGAGVGGNCIPVYPYFLLSVAGGLGSQLRLVELGRRINERMPISVVSAFVEQFIIHKRPLKKAAVLGLAFRGDVDDDRNSPSYDIIERLKSLQVQVRVHDPFVKKPSRTDIQFELTDNLKDALAGADGVLIATDHQAYRDLTYDSIARMAGCEPIVFDARGILYGKERIRVLGKGGPVAQPG